VIDIQAIAITCVKIQVLRY